MTNFKAVLLNTKFDREYRNVLRFDTREAQEEYFNLPSLFSNAENINFNAGSLLETTMTYRIRENEGLNDILSKNYCIVQDLNENRALQYYFYFIRNAMQDAGGQVKLWLELDIFQTYYIDLNFTPCNIQKAHLNRFIDADNGKVKFDGSVESKLFEREDIKNVAKRLTKRTQLSFNNQFDTDAINKWLDENILCWVYIFLDPLHKFKIFPLREDLDYTEFETQFQNFKITSSDGTSMISNMSVLCFPIYKTSNAIFIKNKQEITATLKLSYDAFQHFMENNNGASYIYSVKFSSIPPFRKGIEPQVDTSGNNLTLIASNNVPDQDFYQYFSIGATYARRTSTLDAFDGTLGLLELFGQGKEVLSNKYSTSKQIIFSKDEIIGKNKDAKFNPKLLSTDYFSLRVGNQDEGYDYDLQKVNLQEFSVKYTEALTADITRGYARIAELNGIYTIDTTKNFTGFVFSDDYSISLANSQYQSMLANTKNFFLQNEVRRTSNFATGLLGAGLNFASQNYGAGVASLAGSTTGLVTSKINENLTVDNLKNAPSDISNVKGNAFLMNMVDRIGIFIEEYDILPNEKNIINDYMCLYGFTANFVDDLKKYDNIRKFYNYIQAEIEETTGINISNAVHDKFRQAFRNGVRFWNSDDFNFDKENYERWLENG